MISLLGSSCVDLSSQGPLGPGIQLFLSDFFQNEIRKTEKLQGTMMLCGKIKGLPATPRAKGQGQLTQAGPSFVELEAC